MSAKEKELLKEKIKRAIKLSSQKLIEKKRALGEKLVISEGGIIKVIDPWNWSLAYSGQLPQDEVRWLYIIRTEAFHFYKVCAVHAIFLVGPRRSP